MGITHKLIDIVRKKHCFMYLGKESNIIKKFFDTGFVCYGTLYNCVDNEPGICKTNQFAPN